jgi:hypothetical protein
MSILDWVIGCRECGDRDSIEGGYCALCRYDRDCGIL